MQNNKTKVVSLRLTDDEHEAVKNFATKQKKPLAQLLNELIRKGLPTDQDGNMLVRGTPYRSRCTYCRKQLQLQTGIFLERMAWAHEECEAQHGVQ